MSTINTAIYSGQYYQLPSQSAASGAATSPVSATTAVTSTSSASATSAYSLNLSQSAQDYLNGLGSSSSNSSSSSDVKSTGYTLTSAQKQKITDILTKYKDAPLTQDTYVKIQNDLKAAGLSTDQLAMEKKLKSFNPTQTLIDALNGNFSENSGYSSDSTDPTAQKGDADSFMQSVLNQWKSISTKTTDKSET